MIVSFKFNNEKSSINLDNKEALIVAEETVSILLIKEQGKENYYFIKWLVNIALRTLKGGDLKSIENEFKNKTKSSFRNLKDFKSSDYVESSFKDYKSILIKKLSKVFEKAGIASFDKGPQYENILNNILNQDNEKRAMVAVAGNYQKIFFKS